jgi:hypothetical protein
LLIVYAYRRLLCHQGASRFFHALVEALQRKVVASGCELRMSFEFVKVGRALEQKPPASHI